MIRRGNALDAAAIARIHGDSILAACLASHSVVELVQWVVGHGADFYRNLLEHREVVVCEQEARVVAFGLSTRADGVVTAVHVDPRRMRSGVGRAVVDALALHAAKRGEGELCVHTIVSAVPFYAALGFVESSRTRARIGPGPELDCAVMVKRLR